MHDEMIEQLLQCYTEELACYREICALAAMQQQLCAREDLTESAAWEKFAGILSRRRGELTMIAAKIELRQTIETSLARQLGLAQWDGASLASALHAQPPQAPCAAARRLVDLLPRLAALLQQINALDRQSAQHLEAAREQLKGKMTQLQGWKRAKGAYDPQSRQKEGYFVEHNR